MAEHTSEQHVLLDQLKQVAQGLGETFAPFCEVVVHDLTDPGHAILSIHNNLSGRAVGDPATDLNLHPNSPGYRLILNNVLFPAAKKKKQKT